MSLLPSRPAIALWVKLLYTAFVAVVIAEYSTRGTPLLFLWFCDLGLFMLLVALWTESRLLASMTLLAVCIPQLVWQLDLIVLLTTGAQIVGPEYAAYTFDPAVPLVLRVISTFHGWFPYMLLWVVLRLGYDRRALVAQTVLAWFVIMLSYALTTDALGMAGNLNMVYGMLGSERWIPSSVWFALIFVLIPLLMYAPVHALLVRRTSNASRTKRSLGV